MELTVQATLTGIHPRSEGLVQASRDVDRGRADAKHLAQARAKDAAALVEVQAKAGVTHVSDGLLGFQDLFRPFAEKVQGCSVGPITRWFDNNTFYRQPLVQGALKRTGPILEGYLEKPKLPAGHQWKAILPGPYTWARSVEDTHYRSPEKLLTAFARECLAPEVPWLVKQGYSWIQFNEPWLVKDRPKPEEWEALQKALLGVLDGVKVTSSVATYFGDASPVLPELFDLPVDYVGVDFTSTPFQAFQDFEPSRGLQAGLVDGRMSIVEKPQDLVQRGKELLDATGLPAIALAPSCDLEFLPRTIADEKVLALGEAARALQQEVA
jgi:5-methyltetrahydropteroyltriglutamate--homocysteine methyltransferase